MNISKLLVLPVLFAVSLVSAEQVRLSVQLNGEHADKNLECVVDVSDNQEVFVNEEETRKVEFQKDGEAFFVKVFLKNESGEWVAVSTEDAVVTVEKVTE